MPFSFSWPYSTPVTASVIVHSSITFLTGKCNVVLCFFCWTACCEVTYFSHVSFCSPLEKNWEECIVEQASFSDAAVKWRPELEQFPKPQTKKVHYVFITTPLSDWLEPCTSNWTFMVVMIYRVASVAPVFSKASGSVDAVLLCGSRARVANRLVRSLLVQVTCKCSTLLLQPVELLGMPVQTLTQVIY